jgi:hypothetical protein
MKTITRFMCDVCGSTHEEQKSAEICEIKHKVTRKTFFFVDLEFAQREPNPVQIFNFSSLEEMNLFGYGQKSRIFSGPGNYVYVNATGSFVPLEHFLSKKRKELKEFNKLAENQLKNLAYPQDTFKT